MASQLVVVSNKIIGETPLIPQSDAEKANLVKNINELEGLAVSGNLDMQVYLGCIYLFRKRGYSQAVQLIKNAHENGHIVASLILQEIWLKGIYNRYEKPLTFDTCSEMYNIRNENAKINPVLVKERCKRFQNILEKFEYVCDEDGVYLVASKDYKPFLCKLVELK